MRKYIIFTTILLASVFCIVLPVLAQQGLFSVWPSVIDLDFSKNPSSFVSGAINVQNQSDTVQRVRAYVQNWDMDENGGQIFIDTPIERSLNDYIKFNPKEFDLPPKGKQTVRITAKLPEGEDGEFRGMIFFENVNLKENLVKSGSTKKLNIGVTFVTRYGVAVYAYKGKICRNALLESINEQADKNGHKVLEATFKNEGNVHSYIFGNMSLVPFSGGAEIPVTLRKFTLLPGRTEKMIIRLPEDKMKNGSYNAKLRFTYKDIENKEQVIPAEKTFNYDSSKYSSTKQRLENNRANNEIEQTPENTAEPIIDTKEIEFQPENK